MIGEVELVLEREAAARQEPRRAVRTEWGRPDGAAEEGASAKKKDSHLGGGRPLRCPSGSLFSRSQVCSGLHSQFLAIKLM